MKKRFLIFLCLVLTLLAAVAALAEGGDTSGDGWSITTEDQFSITPDDPYTITTEEQFTIPAESGAEPYTATGTVTTNNVNVRTGPGYSYQAFTQVHRNSVLYVEQRAHADGVTWYFGKINNITGWIHGGFLSFSSVTPPPTQIPVTFVGYIRLDKTNVRTGPDMNSAAFTQLRKGDVFNVTASSTGSNGVTWYYGTCGFVQGWVRGDLISTTPVTPVTPTPGCVTPTSGHLTPVNYAAYVRVSNAEVRNGAGSSHTLLCTLPYGTQVQVLGITYCANMNLWCYVRYDSASYGYIIESSLSAYGPTPAPVCPTAVPQPDIDYTDSFTGYTAMHKVLVRAAPAGLAVQRIEYRGTQVQVQGSLWYNGIKWYLVTYYGGTGYIRYDMITATPSSPTVSPVYPGDEESPVYFAGMTLKNKVNVRYAPSLSSTVEANLNYGTYLNVFGLRYDTSGNAWYHVLYGNSKYGYIYASLVGPYDEAAIRRYYDTHTVVPSATSTPRVYTSPTPNDSSSLHRYRTIAPKKTATPVPVVTAAPWSYVTSVPTALPSPNRITEVLDFSPVTLSGTQTLPVYSAPNSAAWRSDSGTASLSTNRSLWVAGYEGQWMLILYTNEYSQIRVGYINAFRLSGALPTANTLYFAPKIVRLTQSANMTTDPLTGSEVAMTLSAGSEVTWLCACNLGSNWAYVETTINGAAVRGFIPAAAIGQ